MDEIFQENFGLYLGYLQYSPDKLVKSTGLSRDVWKEITSSRMPTSGELLSISKGLGIPLRDFSMQERELGEMSLSLAAKDSDDNWNDYLVSLLLRKSGQWLDDYFDVESYLGIDPQIFCERAEQTGNRLADYLKRKWEWEDPVENLHNKFEERGIRVMGFPDKTGTFQYLVLREKGAIVVNNAVLEEESRENLCYGLYSLFHKESDPDFDLNEANEFVDYFLMPEKEFKKEFDDNFWRSWLDCIVHIKHYFGVTFDRVLNRLSTTYSRENINNIVEEIRKTYLNQEGKEFFLQGEYKPMNRSGLKSDRLLNLCMFALKMEKIGFGRISEVLNIKTSTLRKLLEKMD